MDTVILILLSNLFIFFDCCAANCFFFKVSFLKCSHEKNDVALDETIWGEKIRKCEEGSKERRGDRRNRKMKRRGKRWSHVESQLVTHSSDSDLILIKIVPQSLFLSSCLYWPFSGSSIFCLGVSLVCGIGRKKALMQSCKYSQTTTWCSKSMLIVMAFYHSIHLCIYLHSYL